MKKLDFEQAFYGLSIAVILIGGVLWLSNIDSKASTSLTATQELTKKVDQDQRAFEEIRLHLAHIDDAMNK